MRILITNDDGIYSPGLLALLDAMQDLGEVWLVAPAVEQSGVSHAFSLTGPLRVQKVKINQYDRCFAVRGTPVDVVKLALGEILPEPPDMIISGINRGENSGVNILYSGTVAGAMEGAILGIPSMAVSLATYKSPDYTFAAEFTRKLVGILAKNKLPLGTLINVNIPPLNKEEIKGVKITCQASSHYAEEVEKRQDPRGRDYFWIGGYIVLDGDNSGSDMRAIKDGYISITPIQMSQTNHDFIPVLKEWKFD